MSRLTTEQAIEILKGDFSKVILSEKESHSEVFTEAFNMAIEAIQELQRYKDLEEQGRLIELPCKVGTPIYYLAWEYDELNDKAYFIGESTFCIDDLAGWGEYQFLTKEEAEAKLAELKGTEG